MVSSKDLDKSIEKRKTWKPIVLRKAEVTGSDELCKARGTHDFKVTRKKSESGKVRVTVKHCRDCGFRAIDSDEHKQRSMEEFA